ncbi:unnamed protein product [Clonostachys rosea f. rosea IK726]|uniref:Uncharacterized protein n=1 Tax=Clonostachys rosea f. rosea IK726 TaxID=1349383 RepID=A0ACA9U994_BIOOC|nr:unnamed protein product [Clonostachys rosea f. rosea IK726]
MPPEENDKHETSGSAEKQQNDCSDVTASSVEAPYVSTENRDIAEGTNEVEHWNKPFANIGRLVFAFLSFIIAGMNDGAVGLYHSLAGFLTPFVGYSLAAFYQCDYPHEMGTERNCLYCADLPYHHLRCLAIHPPWPVLIIINIFSGFGNGACDACFCAWVGVMSKANTIQGFMHACYSVGALLAPMIATSFVVSGKLPMVYLLLRHGRAVSNRMGWSSRHNRGRASDEPSGRVEKGGVGLRDALKSKVTWLCAAFFFAYMAQKLVSVDGL